MARARVGDSGVWDQRERTGADELDGGYLKKAFAPLLDSARLSLFRLGRYFLNAVLTAAFPRSRLSLSFPILAFLSPH